MEATASDKSVLARMLSWFFRIVSLKTVPISEQHMIAIHNALFMMAGEFVSQGATTDQHGLNTAMAQALQRNVEGHLDTTLAQYTKDLPALFAEVCLHTNVFCTEEWKYPVPPRGSGAPGEKQKHAAQWTKYKDVKSMLLNVAMSTWRHLRGTGPLPSGTQLDDFMTKWNEALFASEAGLLLPFREFKITLQYQLTHSRCPVGFPQRGSTRRMRREMAVASRTTSQKIKSSNRALRTTSTRALSSSSSLDLMDSRRSCRLLRESLLPSQSRRRSTNQVYRQKAFWAPGLPQNDRRSRTRTATTT